MHGTAREVARQQALAHLAILDTPPEREFDALADLARRMLGTSMSSVTMIDTDRQWFKARCGPLASETARAPAFCTVVVETEAALVIGDASVDPRFAGNPFVVGAPQVRFYAGVPIRGVTPDGTSVPIGTLCVLDDKPRELSGNEVEVLSEFAIVAEALVEARAETRRAVELAEGHRQAVERLERERRQFKQAERMADMGSWRYDLDKQRTEWSDGVFAIHELPIAGGVPEKGLLDFFPEVDRAEFLASVMRTLDTGEPFEMEADFTTAKGDRRRVRCMCEIELSKGKVVALIGLIKDITARHRMEQALLHHARTDDLTQLPNRAEFNRVLDSRLGEADAAGAELAVMLVDLDGFKGVNDALGHATGDAVLRRVADKLRAPYLSDFFAARIGGDEFAIVAPMSMQRPMLEKVVGRLLRELQIVADGPGRIARVSGTVGIAWTGGAPYDREMLLRHADAALYRAKARAKGTAQTYDPTPCLSPVGSEQRPRPDAVHLDPS